MRTKLSPEQVRQVAADVAAWVERHIAIMSPEWQMEGEREASTTEWRTAELTEISQLAELTEECYLVTLTFHWSNAPSKTYEVPYILTRSPDGTLKSTRTYTFRSPDFTRPGQPCDIRHLVDRAYDLVGDAVCSLLEQHVNAHKPQKEGNG